MLKILFAIQAVFDLLDSTERAFITRSQTSPSCSVRTCSRQTCARCLTMFGMDRYNISNIVHHCLHVWVQESRREDAIIAFTWWHFLTDPESNPEYLLRLPMTKAQSWKQTLAKIEVSQSRRRPLPLLLVKST